MRKIIKTKKLINGVSKKILENKCIIIENGKITKVLDLKNFKDKKGDKVYNFNKEVVMPGMVDVHVHLAFSGITNNRSFRAESADLDYGAQALRGYSFALDHLNYGFTSIRDMNAPGNVAINIRNMIKNNKLKTSLANLFDLDLFLTNSEV